VRDPCQPREQSFVTQAAWTASIAAIALCGLTHVAAQGDPVSSTNRRTAPAVQEFLKRHGGADYWRVEWSANTGTPQRIWGAGVEVSAEPVRSLARARDLANGFVDQHADVLGTGNSTFVERIGQTVGQTHVFVYDQYFGGLQVLNGRADVRLHQVGRVSSFGSKTVDIPQGFGLAPEIADDLAWARAVEENITKGDARIEVEFGDVRSRLVIWSASQEGQPAFPRLAWEIELANVEPRVYGLSYIDAKTGEQLEWVDGIFTCALGHEHVRTFGRPRAEGHLGRRIAEARAAKEHDAAGMTLSGNVLGWVNTGLTPNASLSLVPMPGIQVTAPGVGSALTDDLGNFSIPYSGTTPVNVTVNLVGRHVGSMINDQGSTYSLTQSVSPGVPAGIVLSSSGAGEFERSQLTTYWWTDQTNQYARSILGNTPEIAQADSMQVTANIAQTCNAFYTQNTTNYYAAGGSCNNTGYSTVVIHEWGHGLDDRYGVISQVDGLSEGWGDTLAIYMTGQPIIGDDFLTNGGIIRTALNSRTYPDGGFPSGGAPHPKGEVFMGFNWQVRQALIGSLGATAGVARAEEIVIGSVVADATNQPDAIFEIFTLDDDNGNLLDGTVNYDVLAAAAQSRNLPFPERVSVNLTATPIASPVAGPYTAQLVSANAVPILGGSVTGVDVIFGINGAAPTARRAMLSINAGGDYVALLPGVNDGEVVRYRFEASHSSGDVVSFPEVGDFRYTFGDDIVVFSDDFEGADPGWSSVQLAGPVQTGSNDWQLGTPAGRSGTSSGVAWADPSSAFSGANVRGNDLGLTGFNGAYQANIVNELRSPLIDLTGVPNPRVRFARWLTVEEAIFDQATLSVNGIQVWQNPQNGNLVDTAWTIVEYPIPPAAISSAARFEFQLASDGGLQLGGWTIDDFEVVGTGMSTPVPVTFEFFPEQVPAGSTTFARFQGAPNATVAVFVSATSGPINVLGQTLEVGADAFIVFIGLDGTGFAQVPLATTPGLAGSLVFMQGLQISPAGFEASNPQRLLIR
jgi:hypothetical protein